MTVKTKKVVTIYIPLLLLEKLDGWIERQPVKPPRSSVVQVALEEWITKQEGIEEARRVHRRTK